MNMKTILLFWYQKIYIEIVPAMQAVNQDFYLQILKKLRTSLTQKFV